jgi:hypothetical protein
MREGTSSDPPGRKEGGKEGRKEGRKKGRKEGRKEGRTLRECACLFKNA